MTCARLPPDCRTCGACCGQLVVLTHRDRDVPVAMRNPDGTEMGHQGDRCVALAGRIGIDPICTIYPDRPMMCRAFPAGSPPCLFLRSAYHVER
jgi:Fe-S-cluster containining protein